MRDNSDITMNKAQLINAIREVNRSAAADWLSAFDLPSLREYLDHLQVTMEPRVGGQGRVRRGATRAVVTRWPSL